MKKTLFTVIISLLVLTSFAQFNNSWIDYSKTYYKFKVASDGLCRINQLALVNIGLANTAAETFQLWRNGKQVRIYTSIPTGIFGANDFIEFWGEMNDGRPDKALYENTDYQLNAKYSLFADSATYYLTVNPTISANLRYVQSANNIAGNTLTADAYFMRRLEKFYKTQINQGYYYNLNEAVYASDFDKGEGWTSGNVYQAGPLNDGFTNINKYNGGPANSVTYTVSACGNAWYTRNFNASLNGTAVLPKPNPLAFMNSYQKDTIRNLPLGILSDSTALNTTIGISNTTDTLGVDNIVVASWSVTYPAKFIFNNQPNFYFELASSTVGNYLVINNFNNTGQQPILYDINSGKRYLGDISTIGQIKFLLPASTDALRKFNLISQDTSNIKKIGDTLFSKKNFIDFSNVAAQGNYIIISNPALYNNGSGVNYVDQYKQYRSSATGGGYNAQVYNIDELTDQFAFGINKHPEAIRNFIFYANQKFSAKPKFVFVIGRGVTYYEYYGNATTPGASQINLVPTFGWPASDALLVSNPGTIVPIVPIGRIGAVTGNEVGNYLQKMKEYEQVQQSTIQTIANKGWMKNMLHLAGPSTAAEAISFSADLNHYTPIAQDTLFGANVSTFVKTSTSALQDANSTQVTNLINGGLSFITYMGHSSASVLAFNLNDPTQYQNQGKYPFINISGCSAGNFFNFDLTRLSGNLSISDDYTFANEKGSIGFLADTHFGVEPFLDAHNIDIYTQFCKNNYGGTIGDQLKQVSQNLGGNPQTLDFLTRIHLEEVTLQGDPALKVNTSAKPDYVMEPQLIKVSPSLLSVANANFKLNVNMLNIGRATNDSIRVIVNRILPNGTTKVLYNAVRLAMKYQDSLVFVIPINPITDKGLNKIIVTLDADNRVAELSETNNTAEQDFFIYENEISPVYPYDFSIVNQQNITFTASTANPLLQQRQFAMEIDTTELFNSAYKKSYKNTSNGGEIEFKPGNLNFADSTVYYWRTSIVPTGTDTVIWNNFSFVYLANSTNGANQSHYYQHLKSSTANIYVDSLSKNWNFPKNNFTVLTRNGVFPISANQARDFEIDVNGVEVVQSVCNLSNVLIISAFNPLNNFSPIFNASSGAGQYGSDPVCGPTRVYSFAYTLSSKSQRTAAMNFLNNVIPNGYYVVVMNFSNATVSANTYANDWKLDDPTGTNSLYYTLKNAGFTAIDSFNRPRSFNLIYKKNDNSFAPVVGLSAGVYDKLQLFTNLVGYNGTGTITSPIFGPAKKWSQFHYRGSSVENISTDSVSFNIIGISPTGVPTTLFTLDSTKHDFDISSINANQYPNIQLQMFNQDTVNATPYQLKYWRLNYTPVAEGAIAPNILYQMKDTANQGELVNFKIAFKNISPTAFDSAMQIQFTITDNNNLPHNINLPKGKILISGDTLVVQYTIDTKNYPGNNTLFVNINPNGIQPEQYLFNNVLFKNFYVKPDNLNPLLDVTFDGIHILNSDIVAAKPHILIKLTDQSKYIALADTSLIKVQVIFPDNSVHNYSFGDSMKFTPANLATGQNVASIDFTPSLPLDGVYQLLVSGKNTSGLAAGALQYTVSFNVINKPMISNLLNYPNPFTTSTAFVFTITGTVVPQNLRIEILTITGKIVREITKEELGPIHIGTNITEFKWDGTDKFGQKLANGVYLYRVVTNLNGNSLQKYNGINGLNSSGSPNTVTSGLNTTDQFFNKGYGKMVIIR